MNSHPQKKRIVVLIAATGCLAAMTNALSAESVAAVDEQRVQFDPIFLADHSVDVGRFERPNAVLPGTYAVDLVVNNQPIARREVRFVADASNQRAHPCLTLSLLQAAGVDTHQLGLPATDAQDAQTQAEECIDLTRHIADAAVHYDAGEQQLTLSIPQAALRHTARGEVDPSLWSDGIRASLLRYDANVYRTTGGNSNDTTGYVGLVMGSNVGGWRLRHRASVNYREQISTHFDAIETYAQHDLTTWKSTLTLGDSYTNGSVFDSFQVRGVQLASDDRMYPNSLRGYAPVVRGVARTNAKVEVRQNGYAIYQTTVAPGAFTINDLNPTGYGGDLEVVITEADGSKQTYSMPYASVPQLLRAGRDRYSLVLGQYRSYHLSGNPPTVGQLVYQRGISNLLTGYTGAIGTDGYGAALVGAALNTNWGAFALDVTGARTSLPQGTSHTGESWRLSYAKILPQTDTSLTLAAYRYSTSGYYSLSDAMQARTGDETSIWNDDYRMRDRAQININQRIADYGSLYLMGSTTRYWTRSDRDTQYQLGYSGGTRWGSYTVSLQRTRDSYGEQNNQLYVSVSIPLGGGRSDRHPLFSSLNTSLTQDTHGGTSLQTNASGTTGVNNAWSYGMNVGYSSHNDNAVSLGGNGSYNGGKGSVNASASTSGNSSQFSLGASGSMLIHSEGITFGQAMDADSAIGLIKADGAAGAAVTNAAGVVLDQHGYAVVPYLTPYQANRLELDPQGVSDDVELESTSQDVVPRAGAVVKATFATQRGAPVILQVRKADGQVAPMGADVLDAQQRQVGVVGQGGMAFVRGVPDQGTLTVRWASAADAQCLFPYQRTSGNTGNAMACVNTPESTP